MNAEQLKQVEEIRQKREARAGKSFWVLEYPELIQDLNQEGAALLAIVEDLRKQLNGGEIMAECFNAYDVKYDYDSFAAGWLECARFLKAIKEK